MRLFLDVLLGANADPGAVITNFRGSSMPNPDITVIIVFHRERSFVPPALASLADMANAARMAGLAVEVCAILDSTDDETRHLVATTGCSLDSISEVSFADPALTRNSAVRAANGRFVSLLDGDDLWGSEWLRLSYQVAIAHDNCHFAIWHPEHLYYFWEADFNQRGDPQSNRTVQPFHVLQKSSEAAGFESRTLLLENIWTANVFALRELHLRYPYDPSNKSYGFGIEDWSWNIKTLSEGIPHYVVADTVHLIRQKYMGSRGQLDISEGLLPRLPEFTFR